MIKKFKYILLLLLISHGIISQDLGNSKKDSLDYYDMSLEELLNLKAHGVPSELEELINSLISVSSKRAMNTRETPSVISLITEEDIKNSGARDLIDVLRMVPGIDFGVDVEGVVGLGMRGNWSNEGKILILLDGQEMNEVMFASNQLGNRYPVDLIKRIEIIRGPGSAIYGGYAEHGVINIITKQAEDLNGVFVSGTYGQMEKDFGRRNINLAFGKKTGDFSFNVSGMISRGQRSDQMYTDLNGDSYDMRSNSNLNSNYLNFSSSYKKLSLRLIMENYNTSTKGGYGNVIQTEAANENHFENIYAEIKNENKLNDQWKLNYRLNYKSQQPWENMGYEQTPAYHKTATRASGNITATYERNRNFNVVFGTEAYYDHAKDLATNGVFLNGKNTIDFLNHSFFAQSLIKTRLTNFIVGARYDQHSVFGGAFVPRVGLTKKINRFHYKLLFGRAFRAPSIENINSADSLGIKPEFTNVIEFELGYQITKNSFITFNAFDVNTYQPIVYYSSQDSVNQDFYTNFGSSGTQGMEAEYKFKAKNFSFNLNYAYYSAANKPRISFYQSGKPNSLLAFPNHRLNLSTHFRIYKFISANMSASYYDKRWHVSGYDSIGNTLFSQSDPIVLLNCFLQFSFPDKGLNIGIGAFDILNNKFTFIQPYDGGHAPLPGPSREFTLRLQYQFNFKKNNK